MTWYAATRLKKAAGEAVYFTRPVDKHKAGLVIIFPHDFAVVVICWLRREAIFPAVVGLRYELQESIEHPARLRAHSGRFTAK